MTGEKTKKKKKKTTHDHIIVIGRKLVKVRKKKKFFTPTNLQNAEKPNCYIIHKSSTINLQFIYTVWD